MSAAQSTGAPEDGERCHLILSTDVAQVGAAVESVAAYCFAKVDPSPRTWFRLCTVVAEALANAMDNGNRNDPTLRVTVDVVLRSHQIVIAISDEGDGFDPVGVPHPVQTPLESTTGRGLFLIRQLADEVHFNAQGNTIWITLPRT